MYCDAAGSRFGLTHAGQRALPIPDKPSIGISTLGGISQNIQAADFWWGGKRLVKA
jgi:hypothetical protein